MGSPGAFVRVVVASIVVVACHVVTFGVAVAAVGASVPPMRLAALALVVLLAGSIPLNLGGWGPREGIAGWTFAVAGLGASAGVAASTLFGILAMIAVAPGLVVAATSAVRRMRTPAPARTVVLAGTGREGGIVIDRPYVILSAAMSLDGYLDTASPPRLALSNAADFDRVDEVRAHCDAILVGARTVRADNPRLLVRSEERRSRREAQGLPPSPWKVTVTATGDLDPQSKFFTFGDTKKLVYCPRSAVRGIRDRLGDRATVVGLGDEVSVADLVSELNDRGVRTLLVEGGGTVFTQFLAADLVDELQLAIAPFFVGDRRAPRLIGDGRFPWNSDRRAPLVESRRVGDMVLLRYALSERCPVPGRSSPGESD